MNADHLSLENIMTDRETELCGLGLEYAEGIDMAKTILLNTGKTIEQIEPGVWECEPAGGGQHAQFTDLVEAVKFATIPSNGSKS